MEKAAAIQLLDQTLRTEFDRDRFVRLAANMLRPLDQSTRAAHGGRIPDAFAAYVASYERIGTYTDNSANVIDVLVVHLTRRTSVERARTMQRNFVARYLGSAAAGTRDAALVAFVAPGEVDWRLSLVMMQYADLGKTKELTPARRYSFLVGMHENNHTARHQLLPSLTIAESPDLSELLGAFGVERVTREFFEKYQELFLALREQMDHILTADERVAADFASKEISTVDFAKKLLGQIVFLYFLQKKGWLGVHRDGEWGTGPKGFLRALFEGQFGAYDNFFNDVLEPLFYEALAVERTAHYYDHLKAKMPFLNGGLFEPLNDYDWVHTDIPLANELFSNHSRSKEGDVGTGILDVFDRYNFTVQEDEPLEKEVAVDPEMLGKVFENLLEVIDRKTLGSFYTPREIVHFMCEESVVQFLAAKCPAITARELGEFVRSGALAIAGAPGAADGESSYALPEKIAEYAVELDKHLAEIRVCDPAIGSGAFPVGMMNVIVRARDVLTPHLGDASDRNSYEFKRHAIQECLFGVDIDPGAVAIAKLRLWLSLVVDEQDVREIRPLPNLDYKIMQGNSLLEEFEGIQLFDESLVDAKLDAAQLVAKLRGQQTLLQREMVALMERNRLPRVQLAELETRAAKVARQLARLTGAGRSGKGSSAGAGPGLFDVVNEASAKAEHLRELQHQFFAASLKSTKDRLRSEIDQLEWELVDVTLRERGDEATIPLVHELRRANIKPFFLWRLHFADVFRRGGGFDVVIANPPYVGEQGNKETFRAIRAGALGRTFYQAKMDLFYFFFHLALNLLHSDGIACFISTDYYLTATGAVRLRRDLQKRAHILAFIDFAELRIFESAKGQHNMITIVRKTDAPGSPVLISVTDRSGTAGRDVLDGILGGIDPATRYSSAAHDQLFDGPEAYIRLSGAAGVSGEGGLHAVLDKIRGAGAPLQSLCHVNNGVQTGCSYVTPKNLEKLGTTARDVESGDGIFVYNLQNARDRAFIESLTATERALFRPFFKNSDIAPYWASDIASKLLFYSDKNVKTLAGSPHIASRLAGVRPILDDRRQVVTGQIEYFQLQWPRNREIFVGPKIVVPYRTLLNAFAYNEGEWFCGSDCYVITPRTGKCSLKFLAALLNSKLFYLWLYHRGKKKGQLLELLQAPLSEIPIKTGDDGVQREFAALGEEVATARSADRHGDTSVLEDRLDQLTYELYGLTSSEVALVEAAASHVRTPTAVLAAAAE